MDDDRIGKYLAYVLRHRPDELGLTLDPQGWVDAAQLLERMPDRISMADLERIVAHDAKERYSLREGRIRANQGHSVAVQAVDLTPVEPPPLLYHGTTAESWQAIQKSGGLRPMARHHVHLSATPEAAQEVAGRHRRQQPVVLEVDAARMTGRGHAFFRSANGVWMADTVPLQFLTPRLGMK
ncbi:MAG TPA: RNA 2'-phosphotransferase [Candidatus Xenobia bacterium]|jgi:putative RNA 2'-phosphotransferase